MTDSSDSMKHDELTDEDIIKVAQQVPGVPTSTASIKQITSTQKLLKAMGSEYVDSKVSGSKIATNQVPSGTFNNLKIQDQDAHDTSIWDEKITIAPVEVLAKTTGSLQDASHLKKEGKQSNTPGNVGTDSNSSETKKDLKSPTQKNSKVTTQTKDSKVQSKTSHNKADSYHSSNKTVNQNLISKNESDKQSDEVVPESMYTVLQQRAQNVLKMIGEKKTSESATPGTNDNDTGYALSQPPSYNTSQSRPPSMDSQETAELSNESTGLKIAKTLDQNLDDIANSLAKLNDKGMPIDTNNSGSKSKTKVGSEQISYFPNQPKVPSQLLKEQCTVKPPTVNASVTISDSQQLGRSTEELTTDYNVKDTTLVQNKDSLLKQKTSEEQKKETKETESLKGQTDTSTPEKVDQEMNDKQTEAVFKELSQIIEASDIPDKLSKKGEHICKLFRQKLLNKLEASGNVDKRSAELATITASKFAKWVEDILIETDLRKNSSLKENQKTTKDSKGTKEEKDQDDDEFFSATSSKESVTRKEDLAVPASNEQDDQPEVVKIHEISDSELMEKYGTHLENESHYHLFQFLDPDNKPVEVRHLTSIIAKKVMIVKKITSDTQWSNWVVEVGPDVTLDDVSERVN